MLRSTCLSPVSLRKEVEKACYDTVMRYMDTNVENLFWVFRSLTMNTSAILHRCGHGSERVPCYYGQCGSLGQSSEMHRSELISMVLADLLQP